MVLKHFKLLERFHQRCLRAIFSIKWQGHTTNIEVLEKADLPNIEAMLILRQLRWAGHVTLMVHYRMPKFVFYGELSYRKRSIGAPRRRYKDQLKQQLGWAGIDHCNWQTLALKRSSWRTHAKRAVQNFEEERVRVVKEKRRRRKEPTIQTSSASDQVFPCPNCSKPCRSRIGLYSHQKACRTQTGHYPLWSLDSNVLNQ